MDPNLLLLTRLFVAAEELVLAGAGVAQVDTAAVQVGLQHGPFLHADRLGLDHTSEARRHLRIGTTLHTRLLELGRLGQDAGAGWYSYAQTAEPSDDPVIVKIARQEARLAGIREVAVGDLDIQLKIMRTLAQAAALHARSRHLA